MRPLLPDTDTFWILSSGFMDAADAALERIEETEYRGFAVLPCIFLSFRSIELALKSYLAKQGYTQEQIKERIGHNLLTLIKHVETVGALSEIGLEPDSRLFIEMWAQKYSFKWFEYPDDVLVDIPDPRKTTKIARRICEAIRHIS